MGLFDFFKASPSKNTVPTNLPLLCSFDKVTFTFENAESFSVGNKVFFKRNPTKEDDCGVDIYCYDKRIGCLPYGRIKVYVANGLKNPKCKIIGEITDVKKVKATVRIDWYEDVIVLCSPNGKCYHSDSCSSLPSDCVEISISKAEKIGLSACKKCGGELKAEYLENRYYRTK